MRSAIMRKPMNSYERVMTALNRQVPDRVPVGEMVVMPPVYRKIMPEAREEYEFHAKYLDMICIRNRYRTEKVGPERVKDEWGVIYAVSGDEGKHPLVPAFSLDDDFMAYPLPDPYDDFRFGPLKKVVERYKGEKALAYSQRACFLWAVALLGFEETLMGFLAQPQEMHRLLDKILEHNINMAVRAVELGADIVFETDDYGYNVGPLFSPEIFDEFLRPRLKRFTDAVHAAGGKVVKHTDGNIKSLLPGIVSTGVDGIHSIDPLGGMDMGEVKELYGDKVCFFGNIEPGILIESDAETVRAKVRECIDKGAKGGGLVVASSNTIMAAVKPENYLAMIDETKRYGIY